MSSINRLFYVVILLVTVGALLTLSSQIARADDVPTAPHAGADVHIDPFLVSGWQAANPPPPAAGQIFNINGKYETLGPTTGDMFEGDDNTNAPNNPYHWELEVDFDPYGNVVGVNPSVNQNGELPVLFDFTQLGGGTFFKWVPLLAGLPDIRLDIHEDDWFGETAHIWTYFINDTTDLTPGWGVSVTEFPAEVQDNTPTGKEVIILGDEQQNFSAAETGNNCNGMTLSFDGNEYVLAQGPVLVPEPASLLLMGLGAAGILFVRRRHGLNSR
jgi:hypothetical protein